jgi:hypothetical protein
MPDHTSIEQEDVPTPALPVTLDMPGTVADFLRADLEPAERAALDQGVTVRRGHKASWQSPSVAALQSFVRYGNLH